jgi:cytochrome c-type biogenesis protein CcmH/NrfG
MYRDGGSIALATMAYRKALELQPRNVAAREALQALRDPPSVKPAEATSVLKRMFGR